MKSKIDIRLDSPLQVESALDQDKLSRKGFSEIAVKALRNASSDSGLVLSIEGEWGSGKTSTLAIIEKLLKKDESTLVIHFNPWLIGEKDALLHHFLSQLASAIKLNDHSKTAKRAVKEIKAYSKAFDLVKFIPGAEPWATIIKSVIDATGDVSQSIAEYKTPDIETYRNTVKMALQKLKRPIVIFIDDIDRLFPSEVFEMVRIIKAVGDLPYVAHVVAWDSAYVSSSLEKLGIPHAHSYLDKIVQIRMPLPTLALSARRKMIDDALNCLDPQALQSSLPNQEGRLGRLYNSGLRDFLEQPRDIIRVFNALQIIEPLLRDEVIFSDILGLSALSIKAPAVFELIKKKPYYFAGKNDNDYYIKKSSKDLILEGTEERKIAYEASGRRSATQRLVHFLFDGVASAEDGMSLGSGTYAEGCICHPGRLTIALQLNRTDGDISIKLARQYLQEPSQRPNIISQLNRDNYEDFISLIGDYCNSVDGKGIPDTEKLCISIAQLPDQPLLVNYSKEQSDRFKHSVIDTALQTISKIIRKSLKEQKTKIAEKIAQDPLSLSCAKEIIAQSYIEDYRIDHQLLVLSEQSKEKTISNFSRNLINSANKNTLLDTNYPGSILWIAAQVTASTCPEIFHILKKKDPTLDEFALHILGSSWDSSKGRAYKLPKNISLLEAYCPLKEFKSHAAKRLTDHTLVNPKSAAWKSVTTGKELYGVDGTETSR